MLPYKRRTNSGLTAANALSKAAQRSSFELKFRTSMFRLTSPHRCSTKFMSGLWGGHCGSSTFTRLSANHRVVDVAVCGGGIVMLKYHTSASSPVKTNVKRNLRVMSVMLPWSDEVNGTCQQILICLRIYRFRATFPNDLAG